MLPSPNARGGRPPQDLTGRWSGDLEVLRQVSERRTRGRTLWLCRCHRNNCGNLVMVRADCIRGKQTKSCGCFRKEVGSRNLLQNRGQNRKVEEWKSLLDVLCDEVLTRFPQTPREILKVMRQTWGGCQDRRFRRALSVLVKQGRVVRIGKFQSSDDESGSKYHLPRKTYGSPIGVSLGSVGAHSSGRRVE